jgi:hypothetical protein
MGWDTMMNKRISLLPIDFSLPLVNLVVIKHLLMFDMRTTNLPRKDKSCENLLFIAPAANLYNTGVRSKEREVQRLQQIIPPNPYYATLIFSHHFECQQIPIN